MCRSTAHSYFEVRSAIETTDVQLEGKLRGMVVEAVLVPIIVIAGLISLHLGVAGSVPSGGMPGIGLRWRVPGLASTCSRVALHTRPFSQGWWRSCCSA